MEKQDIMDYVLKTPENTNPAILKSMLDQLEEGSGGSGSSSAGKKQVNFIDYDGTILYSYTAEEAQALTALPENPSHSGLIAQGWNWSLENIKSQLTNVGGDVWVGQMYDTESGKTEIDINVDNPDFLSPYLAIAVNGTCTIDWGDGTATDTVTGTSYDTPTFTPHVYATTGRYTISIDGPMGFFGGSSLNGSLLTDKASLSNRRTYSQYVEAIRCADGVHIGACPFSGCFALQSITIPDGVTSIVYDAFQNCYALQSITIPDGVTSIGNGAFNYCYSLQSITIPNSVTSIGGGVFYSCYALQSITIPEGVTSIGGNTFQACYALQSITIPDGVTSIGSNAFYGCSTLQSITIPDSVTSIGGNAFAYCSVLQSITIHNGVTSIGDYAFDNCYALQSITIPDGVKNIGSNAFGNCPSIMEYHFLPTTPPKLNKNAFTGIIAGTIIYVPQGSLEAYKTANNWSNYASYMHEEP